VAGITQYDRRSASAGRQAAGASALKALKAPERGVPTMACGKGDLYQRRE
jgi:hypothetical protein